MDQKESRPGKDGSKRKHGSLIQPDDRHAELVSPAGAKRKYVRGMGAEACRKSLRRMLGPKSKPGRASDYMQKGPEFIKQHPDIVVYIIVRESTREQRRRRNHDNYRLMVEDLEGRGIPARVFPVTCSGKIIEPEWRDVLEWVVQKARKQAAQTGKTVVILAFSADRFLRNVLYKNTTPKLLPTRWEYRQLKRLVGDVPLLTWVDPDMPPEKARGLQSKLGQQTKGNKGGGDRMPGCRKRRKAKLQPKAQEMLADGATFAQIAKRLGVSIRTAWLWAKAV